MPRSFFQFQHHFFPHSNLKISVLCSVLLSILIFSERGSVASQKLPRKTLFLSLENVPPLMTFASFFRHTSSKVSAIHHPFRSNKKVIFPATNFSRGGYRNIVMDATKLEDVQLTVSSEQNKIPMSERLWENSLKEAYRSLHHPWVVSLALGTLDRESFAQYIAQDAFFLESFAKGYAFALGKCPDREGITAFHGLIGAVLEELQLHSGLAQRWGLDLEALREPKVATTEYVDFLISTAQDPQSTSADILASMAPCMRLYAFLGQTIKKSFCIAPDHPYSDWIETYSSEEFEVAAKTVEDLLDKYANDAFEPKMMSLYHRAMELEYNFFDAQAVSEQERLRALERLATVCVDFDETCTTEDTTPLLLELVKANRPAEEHDEIDRVWQELVDLYLNDYSKTMAEVQSSIKQEGPLDFEDEEYCTKLAAYLEPLTRVSVDSVARVINSKVMKGIHKDSIHELLNGNLRSKWELRAGCLDALHRLSSAGVETKIVSINWSSLLISSLLQTTPAGGQLEAEIFSNDLCFDSSLNTTGDLTRDIDGATEKKVKFLAVAGNSLTNNDNTKMVMYFGDSLTDLLAMEASDIPIFIGSSSSFVAFCAAAGIDIIPLFGAYKVLLNSPQQNHIDSKRKFVIYHAESWSEVQLFCFGTKNRN